MIPRKEYLDFLIHAKDLQLIKVISGIRRCGKSTLLQLYIDYLLQQGIKKEQIININLEDVAFEPLQDYHALYQYIEDRLIPGEKTYVFLDEIQHVPQFERAADSLFIKDNVDLYITGSNAFFMSGELATLLSGRYIELKMFPLSFAEYALGTSKNIPLNEKYLSYLHHSSFPYALQLASRPQILTEYLQGLYNTIILKDIVARYKINDIGILEAVIKFMFDNIGNPCSIAKIAHTLTSTQRKIDAKTVDKYLKILQDSLILYKTQRYNIKGKEYLQGLGKYYVIDIGMRFMLLGHRNIDVGHILENIVYLELIRRGYQVASGKVGELEIDFVASSSEETIYYQVAASTRDAQTLARELAPLQALTDSYPKFILTLDDDPSGDYDGIKRVNALKWLLHK